MIQRLFKQIVLAAAALCFCLPRVSAAAKQPVADQDRVIVAYVTSWSDVMPDPKYMTHINYAFGHVNDTFDGVRIDNEERLHQIVSLKQQKPELKVLLSIGGWGSGRFSEMAATAKNRKSFAADCRRVVEEFGLDGIDIDWEYPTSSAAGISSSPDDTKNFTQMMKAIRKAIGKKKLLTLATAAGAEYIDFRAILSSIDFVNVMSYDMGSAPIHHAALYPSEHTGKLTASTAIEAHMKAGVPAHKLTMGVPFYGRGGKNYPNFRDFNKVGNNDPRFTELWDDTAKVPYLADKQGNLVFGFENTRSLAGKCDYIKQMGLLGGMYWEYSGDNKFGDLRSVMYENLLGGAPRYKVLVIAEDGGWHVPFSEAGYAWLREEAKAQSFEMTIIHNAKPINEEFLKPFNLIIQLDFVPYTWSKEAQDAFIKYIDEGQGGWVGFHHATLLGDFDGYPMWKWFSDFMGGITYQNYIPETASGTVTVEARRHPVTQGVPLSFVIPDDEWYIYDKSPRANVNVLLHVDESTYQPASSVTMGDHPVVWVNEEKAARNVYFQMGHSPKLFEVDGFTTLFRNAIRWVLKR